jgi:hypothetical protein
MAVISKILDLFIHPDTIKWDPASLASLFNTLGININKLQRQTKIFPWRKTIIYYVLTKNNLECQLYKISALNVLKTKDSIYKADINTHSTCFHHLHYHPYHLITPLPSS